MTKLIGKRKESDMRHQELVLLKGRKSYEKCGNVRKKNIGEFYCFILIDFLFCV